MLASWGDKPVVVRGVTPQHLAWRRSTMFRSRAPERWFCFATAGKAGRLPEMVLLNSRVRQVARPDRSSPEDDVSSLCSHLRTLRSKIVGVYFGKSVSTLTCPSSGWQSLNVKSLDPSIPSGCCRMR
jgi:hypothetical protein